MYKCLDIYSKFASNNNIYIYIFHKMSLIFIYSTLMSITRPNTILSGGVFSFHMPLKGAMVKK